MNRERSVWRRAAWAALIAFGVFLGSVAFGDEAALVIEGTKATPTFAKSLFMRLSHEISETSKAVYPKVMTEFDSLHGMPFSGVYVKKLISNGDDNVAVFRMYYFPDGSGNDHVVLGDFGKTRPDILGNAMFGQISVRFADIVDLDADLESVGRRSRSDLMLKGRPVAVGLSGQIHAHAMDSDAGQLQANRGLGAQFGCRGGTFGSGDRRLYVAGLDDTQNCKSGGCENQADCGNGNCECRVVEASSIGGQFGGERYEPSIKVRLFLTFAGIFSAFGLSLRGWKNIYGERWLSGALLIGSAVLLCATGLSLSVFPAAWGWPL